MSDSQLDFVYFEQGKNLLMQYILIYVHLKGVMARIYQKMTKRCHGADQSENDISNKVDN